ncbi:MAG TPA: hypothetical protein VGJ95_04085 [Pseudonocardiaceae bacterium]|jgi:hypothetical protein
MRVLLTVLARTATMVALVAGCSADPDPGPRFDDGGASEGAGEIACMQHQAAPPGLRYTDPDRRRSREVLALLRYYTANGAKPYCDDQAATEVDRRWARLYVDLGADRTNVAAVLG